MTTIDVLLPLPLGRSFTYACEETCTVGDVVHVPWRTKSLIGIVTNISPTPPPGIELKIATRVDVSLSLAHLSFLEKVATYNLIPLGLVLKMMLLKDEKVFETNDKNTALDFSNSILPPLNKEQEHAYQCVENHQNTGGGFQTFLLDGVTGSGKTEVYFHTALKILQEGKQVLILLPEIGLTTPFLERFKKRFGCSPHVWHSNATPKQKRLTWQEAISGKPCVIVGARSALFLPLKNLGFIVVDEEHDSAYKQEEQSLYHARDMAILRARTENIPILLASATPSLESFYNTQCGKSVHLSLPSRHGNATLPNVYFIDRRKYPRGVLSEPLLGEIQKRLDKDEQSLLFLNRRGYAPVTLCQSCGFRFSCPGCDASLIFHKKRGEDTLLCHYCGHEKPLPHSCPECEKDTLIHFGPGIEKVVEEVRRFFPSEQVAILSSDMTPKEQRLAWEGIYEHNTKIIVGTQLLTKGHHLPKLTLVGVVDADMGLMGCDLRASERAFQLLQQVGGRAGRSIDEGEVWLQTYQPENPLFTFFKNYDRDGFYQNELEARNHLSLPPFGRLASLIFSSFQKDLAEHTARHIAQTLRQIGGIHVLGPVEAPLARLKSRHRFRLLLKGPVNASFGKTLARIFDKNSSIPSTVRVIVDIDPQSFV